MSEKSKIHVAGFYVVLSAIIGGVITVIGANWPKTEPTNPEPTKPTASNTMALVSKSIPQRVNYYFKKSAEGNYTDKSTGEELATFQFLLTNKGEKQAKVFKAEFRPHQVKTREYAASTAMYPYPMDHSGHLDVWVGMPREGKPIKIPIGMQTINPDNSYTFIVWFKSRFTPMRGFLDITGDVEVYFDDDTSITEKISVSIASDSKEIHYKD